MGITTTELIALLQKHEKGGVTGRSRELSFYIEDQNGELQYVSNMEIKVEGCGDGLFTDLSLRVVGEVEQIEHDEE